MHGEWVGGVGTPEVVKNPFGGLLLEGRGQWLMLHIPCESITKFNESCRLIIHRRQGARGGGDWETEPLEKIVDRYCCVHIYKLLILFV